MRRLISLIALVGCLSAGCSHRFGPEKANVKPPAVRFQDVTSAAGLRYRWEITGSRPLNAKQTIGNGCAFLDFDQDGNLDILLVGPKIALFRGDGKGRFADVSVRAGVAALSGDFLGCAVGDADNDGYPDLYLSGYRESRLLHNEGGRRYRDATAGSGLIPQPFGVSCAWADYDGDGRLDLYVANYLRFDEKTSPLLCNYNGVPSACGPRFYAPERGVLYRNLGGLRFKNVTERAGVSRAHGKGLGVAFADVDGSGRPSLTLANDETPGELFRNRGGRFDEVGEISGVAYDARGGVHGGMGVDWGDYDNDGDFDLVVTTFQGEAKCLYRNDGAGDFTEVSSGAGLTAAIPLVSFGVKWLDFDNDGWLDLAIVSGHIQDNIAAIDKSAAYRQPVLLFHNVGGRFEDVSASGLGTLPPLVGRGLAIGDYDNDGRMDILLVDSEGMPRLLHNESLTEAANYLSLSLVGGGASNRDAYGAKVTLEANGRKYLRYCHADGSFLSSSDTRVHFGLGAASKANRIIVRWPDGATTLLRNVTANQSLTLRSIDAQAIPAQSRIMPP